MKKIDERSVELHERFADYGGRAKEWTRRCILMLPDIARHEVWKKKGFGSLSEYAGKIAGLSHRQVKDGLRVLRRIEDKPALRKVAEERGVNAVKPVVVVSTVETDEFWAGKAGEMSKNELETYVRDFRNSANGSECLPRKESRPEEQLQTITMELGLETVYQLEKLKGDGTWEDAMGKLLQIRKQELEKGKPEAVKMSSKHIPNEMQRYIDERDCCTCVMPGCNRLRHEFHHVDGFARVKCHDPDRMFSVCKDHHKLAHRGLIENEHLAPCFWRVREEPDKTSPRFWIDQSVVRHKAVFV